MKEVMSQESEVHQERPTGGGLHGRICREEIETVTISHPHKTAGPDGCAGGSGTAPTLHKLFQGTDDEGNLPDSL